MITKFHSYYVEKLRVKSAELELIFDTGAQATVIPKDFIYKITDSTTLLSTQPKVFKGVCGSTIKAYLVNIKNVNIAGVTIPNFYAYVKDSKVCLLGFDFINACKLHKDTNCNIQISNFCLDTYNDFWKSLKAKANLIHITL